MENDTRSRGWLLTIPYIHDGKKLKIKDVIDIFDRYTYGVFQLELGDKTSYKHYQLYIEHKQGIRFSTLKKLIPYAHIEERKGTKQQAYDYCTKQSTRLHGPFEFGTKPDFNDNGTQSGLRARMISDISAGMNDMYLVLNYPSIYSKRLVDEIRLALGIKDPYLLQNRDIEVSYIYGKPGTGKTSFVRAKHNVSDLYVVSDYIKDPFGGYSGQDVIVFEEYRSNFPLSVFLQYLDRYPIELPARYNNKVAKFTKVYIISNWELNEQYPSLEPVDRQAFFRRIKFVYQVNDDYIYRNEYDKKFRMVNRSYVVNPLGNLHEQFPLLPTRFEDLQEV